MAIKTGDWLLVERFGEGKPVQAISNEEDGNVVVKHKATILNVSVYDVRPVSPERKES